MAKFNALLVGTIGDGKTSALRTVVDAGKELFVLATEPGVVNILGDLPPNRCHIHYVPTATFSWDTLKRVAEQAHRLPMDKLQTTPAPDKAKCTQFIEVISGLANFIDDRTGEEFGPVDFFDDSRVFALDGLTGLSTMARHLLVGAKPIMTQPEWGAAMETIFQLITKLTDDTKCSFILIAHVDRVANELTGGTNLSVSTLGQKLAPKLIKPFDEVIYANRQKDVFSWSTIKMGVELKTRLLTYTDGIKPDFGLLIKAAEAQEAAST